MSLSEHALQRLLRDDPLLRREFEGKILDFLRKYNRDQPRVPAGNSDGGQWTNTGGGLGTFGLQPGTIRPLLIQPSVSTPPQPDLHTLVQQAFYDDRRREDDISSLDSTERVDPFEHSPGIRPLDPTGGFDPSAHPSAVFEILHALELYNWLTASNGPSSQAVVKFNAQGYHRESGEPIFRPASVENLDYSQVKHVCGDSIDQVQAMTDAAVKKVLENGGATLPPAQFGTAVHSALARAINGPGGIKNPKDPDFVAEKSLIKTEDAGRIANYGEEGSIRVDVLVHPNPQTACVYDLKNGATRLSPGRITEIFDTVFHAFGKVRDIIVTEIKPTPWRR